jgi:hydrogenase nickel incorporation protein HypA/HybF
MHELSITQNIVAIAIEHAGEQRVKSVTLDIGKLSAIMPDAIRFCFDVCSKDTLLENATLEINEIPGLGRCESCSAEIELDQPFGVCSCGSIHITCIAGEELKIREMEVF